MQRLTHITVLLALMLGLLPNPSCVCCAASLGNADAAPMRHAMNAACCAPQLIAHPPMRAQASVAPLAPSVPPPAARVDVGQSECAAWLSRTVLGSSRPSPPLVLRT